MSRRCQSHLAPQRRAGLCHLPHPPRHTGHRRATATGTRGKSLERVALESLGRRPCWPPACSLLLGPRTLPSRQLRGVARLTDATPRPQAPGRPPPTRPGSKGGRRPGAARGHQVARWQGGWVRGRPPEHRQGVPRKEGSRTPDKHEDASCGLTSSNCKRNCKGDLKVTSIPKAPSKKPTGENIGFPDRLGARN